MTLHLHKKIKVITAVLLISCIMFTGCFNNNEHANNEDFTQVPQDVSANANDVPTVQEATSVLNYRAVWISYLDWTAFDMTNEQTFTQSVNTVYDNCVNLGLNTVIVQVRPFSDAIYESTIYPYSHVLTGTQGTSIGYDALEIMINLAHERGLFFEAWINPYRVSLSETMPGELASNNPALTNPSWVREVNGGLYFDPSIPEVQQMIIDGTLEIVNNYDVDGIQFDDYFYPTTDASFDEENYAALANGKSLEEWRRDNVNTLVKNVYDAIKAANPNCVFGISPQGNNDNNYNSQYSDVNLWLSTPGYVDYIMPQLYWGFNYETSSGSERFAFENITDEWLNYPRHEDVALAMGLGAFRIPDGDGGYGDQSEWQSGNNLAKMVNSLENKANVGGFAIFRYQNLFDNSNEYQTLEKEALLEELNN